MKPATAGEAGPQVDVGRGGDLEEAAAGHHGHLVREREGLALVVGDQQGRRATGAQGADDGATGVLAQAGVQGGERLVEKDQGGIGG